MRALVAEDVIVARVLLTRLLVDAFERVDQAGTAASALEHIRESFRKGEPYDLICLDLDLGDASGIEVLTELRRLEADNGQFGARASKVVMVTASSDGDDILNAFREQADAYLTKPVTKPELVRVLRRVVMMETA